MRTARLPGLLLIAAIAGCYPKAAPLPEPPPPVRPDPSRRIPEALAFRAPDYNRLQREARGRRAPTPAETPGTRPEIPVLRPTGAEATVVLEPGETLRRVLGRAGIEAGKVGDQAAVLRQGRAVKERFIVVVDLDRLLLLGDLDEDLPLRPGDLVFVPLERGTLLEELFGTCRVRATVEEDLAAIESYLEMVEAFSRGEPTR